MDTFGNAADYVLVLIRQAVCKNRHGGFLLFICISRDRTQWCPTGWVYYFQHIPGHAPIHLKSLQSWMKTHKNRKQKKMNDEFIWILFCCSCIWGFCGSRRSSTVLQVNSRPGTRDNVSLWETMSQRDAQAVSGDDLREKPSCLHAEEDINKCLFWECLHVHTHLQKHWYCRPHF